MSNLGHPSSRFLFGRGLAQIVFAWCCLYIVDGGGNGGHDDVLHPWLYPRLWLELPRVLSYTVVFGVGVCLVRHAPLTVQR